MTNYERFFIVTGGPGSGKSTLLDALRDEGYATSQEAGRGIIRDQVEIEGHALPWLDPALFAELMLCWEMRNYQLAQEQSGVVMFDRGIPDIAGYLTLTGLPVPAHVSNAARRFPYNGKVFIAPPWKEIFRQDAERRQTLDEAERTHAAMVQVYTDLGYTLIELPKTAVADLVKFVLAEIHR